MIDKLKTWFGLEKKSDYVRKFLFESNVRAVVYMAIIVILLEIWMIERLTKIVIKTWPRDFDWLFSHYRNYVVLLLMGIVALVYALRYLRRKTKNRTAGTIILWAFSIICIIFGIQAGLKSYTGGEQVLAFLTMTTFVFCILYWQPLQSLVFSIASFLSFYILINRAIPATDATRINLFTMWITTLMVALSAYHQKISEATKGENLEAINEHLERISNEDELTAIHNMRYFDTEAPSLAGKIRKAGGQPVLLYLDIENFKFYNEKYGFAKGNELLKQLAVIISETFEKDLAARVSDDHFAVLCSYAGVKERVDTASQRILKLDDELHINLKCGACRLDESETDFGYTLDRARIACSTIKKKFNTFYAEYDEKLDTEVRRKQYIINNIDMAVTLGWIKVYYQPVVKCSGGHGELVGFEALARWDDPEFGLLPPYAFISTLEEYHEIHKLDQCIIEQVCQHLRQDIDAGRKVVPVSLNFSRLDFELYDVPQYLHDQCVIYEIPSNLLDVEITESALTEQHKELLVNIARLHDDKFSVWLDDFGSGYSSLNVLKDFSFDVLKIDMMFLRDYPQNQNCVPIVTMIVELAKKLGMVTLCEGVETIEQFEFLQSVGCDKAQGYYFSKPLPREEILEKYFS